MIFVFVSATQKYKENTIAFLCDHPEEYTKNALYYIHGQAILLIQKASGLQEGWYLVDTLLETAVVRGEHIASTKSYMEHNAALDTPGWESVYRTHIDGMGILN